jgi:L-alanine-DL-glutamate epimerase-like enolase superfamily enzyme
MKLSLHQFDLPLRHVFTIARGSSEVYRALVVELEHDGIRGYGESGENTFYGATIDNMSKALDRVRPLVEAAVPDDPAALWEQCRPLLGDNTFAQCALDVATHDLWGKRRGQPVWQLWGLDLQDLPPTDYTIGLDSIEKMVAKLQEFPGWPVYKIKLGTSHDLEIVRALRRHTGAVFRVDANCGWNVQETVRNARVLKNLDVEFIEQPLPADDWAGMKEVHRQSALPLIADESCQTERDVDRCDGHFHGVNIKLVKCGGLTPARRMIARARQLGMKVMVGCMTESTVGISAIAQLLPLLDYVDMDGALLLAEDIATGVTIDRGRVKFPKVNGCGVELL